VGQLSGTDSVNVAVCSATSAPSWDENTLTWNNRFSSDANPVGTITVDSSNDQIYTLDLTSFLKSQLASGQTQVTLILKSASSTISNAIFHSKESSSGAPQLI